MRRERIELKKKELAAIQENVNELRQRVRNIDSDLVKLKQKERRRRWIMASQAVESAGILYTFDEQKLIDLLKKHRAEIEV